jgi:hypothetical protein
LEGQKINKERITLVICANSDNSEKIPLTIIVKHLNPHCFKGINHDTLGARYHANAKAWMTENIFRLWLLDFDRRMQGYQVLLLLDNCPSHIPLEKFAEMNVVLCNTCVFYLPPNMTSAVQPCDAGIIRTFKGYYRKRFNNLLLDGYENNIDNPEKISISRCVPPSSPNLGGGCFACHNRQLLSPLQNPDQRHHPHTTRGSWSSHHLYPGAASSSGSTSIRESHGHPQSSQLSKGEKLHGGMK